MDTGVKTEHLHHAPRWCNEDAYWANRQHNHDDYVKEFGDTLKDMRNGQVVVTNEKGVAV